MQNNKYNFNKIADDFLDPNGSMKPIHLINKTRIEYIVDIINANQTSDNNNNFSILDFGCGAGLVSQPLAKLGYNVTGIDIAEKLIVKAKQQASLFNIKVDYQNISLDKLITAKKKFNLILILEVIEHMSDYITLIKKAKKMLKKDGILIVSTINKTIQSYIVAIMFAENILNMLEKGTHQFQDFVDLLTLKNQLKSLDFDVIDTKGIVYSPLGSWVLSNSNTSVNYILTAKNL